MQITDCKGARIVFDPVGGPYVDTLAQAMAQDGVLFIYGGLSGQPTTHPHWPAAFKNLSIRGWVASTIWNHPDRFARAKDLILRGLADGHLKPVIAKTFPLQDIAAAHRYLESNQQVGKIVVTSRRAVSRRCGAFSCRPTEIGQIEIQRFGISIARLSAASAASCTASDSVGCAWIGALQVFAARGVFHRKHGFGDQFARHRSDDVDAEDLVAACVRDDLAEADAGFHRLGAAARGEREAARLDVPAARLGLLLGLARPRRSRAPCRSPTESTL